ncbi:MAG: energy transducer TonB [Kiritimatiellia bacterium]|jgi:protein TonB
MSTDGSSSPLCKTAALLLAGGAHALLFALAGLDTPPPPIPQPAATRIHILPSAPATAPEPMLHTPPPPEPEPEAPPPEPEAPAAGVRGRQPPSFAHPSPAPAPAQSPAPEPPPPATSPVGGHPVPTQSPEAAPAAEDADGAIDAPPAPHRPIKPEYPLEAKQEQWEGDVTCSALVSKRGRVLEASVVQSSGHAILDAAALKAVRAARFSPALKRGRPVELRVRLTIAFRLSD